MASDLDKAEKLNKEAFPRKSEFHCQVFTLSDREDAHFFAFYNQEEFVPLLCHLSNQSAFLYQFLLPPLEKPRVRKGVSKLTDFLPANHATVERLMKNAITWSRGRLELDLSPKWL